MNHNYPKTRKPPTPSTPAQRWAQKRNFAKKRIKFIRANAEQLAAQSILTIHERDMLTQINIKLTHLLSKYPQRNASSKHDYLKENS